MMQIVGIDLAGCINVLEVISAVTADSREEVIACSKADIANVKAYAQVAQWNRDE